MGILLVLGVVNLTGSQANARDAERKADIETIAMYLETYYNSGTDGSTAIGQYPFARNTQATGLIHNETSYLRDIDPNSLRAPGVTTGSSLIATGSYLNPPVELTATNQYVYQPIANDGSICYSQQQVCRKFNLYYKLEIATSNCPAPKNICMITSKNQ